MTPYCLNCDSACDLTAAWCAVCEGWRHGVDGLCSARRWASRSTSSQCACALTDRLVPGLEVDVAVELGLRDLGWSRIVRFRSPVLAVSAPQPPYDVSRPLHVVVVGSDGSDLSVSAACVRPATERMRVEDAVRAFFAALAA